MGFATSAHLYFFPRVSVLCQRTSSQPPITGLTGLNRRAIDRPYFHPTPGPSLEPLPIMDKLPRELVDHILRYLVWTGNRNEALQARLVCRMFDRFLKSYACRTVSLNFSRLNKQEIRRRPHLDDLQTIGKHCKALNIDLTPIRDDSKCNMPPSPPETLF